MTFTTVATTNPLQRPFTRVSHLHAALRRSTGRPSFLRKRDLFDDFVSNNKITADVPRVNPAPVNLTTTTGDSVVKKWDKDGTHTFNLLDVHKNFPIFDGSINCPAPGSGLGFSANAHLDTDVDVSVTLTVGYIISGKIFPPSITRAASMSVQRRSAHSTRVCSACTSLGFLGLISLVLLLLARHS